MFSMAWRRASSIAAAADFTDSGECGKDGSNVTWTLNSDGVLAISGTGEMKSCADYVSYDMKSSAPWYNKRENIRSVVIENGVTSIGKRAFHNCYNLVDVILPVSVEEIGEEAFRHRDKLMLVRYGGSEKNKEQIAIDFHNDPLEEAEWRFNSELAESSESSEEISEVSKEPEESSVSSELQDTLESAPTSSTSAEDVFNESTGVNPLIIGLIAAVVLGGAGAITAVILVKRK